MNIKYQDSFKYSTKILLRTLDYLYNLDKKKLLISIDIHHFHNSQLYKIINKKDKGKSIFRKEYNLFKKIISIK